MGGIDVILALPRPRVTSNLHGVRRKYAQVVNLDALPPIKLLVNWP
jgi:hypothetical protein